MSWERAEREREREREKYTRIIDEVAANITAAGELYRRLRTERERRGRDFELACLHRPGVKGTNRV